MLCQSEQHGNPRLSTMMTLESVSPLAAQTSDSKTKITIGRLGDHARQMLKRMKVRSSRSPRKPSLDLTLTRTTTSSSPLSAMQMQAEAEWMPKMTEMRLHSRPGCRSREAGDRPVRKHLVPPGGATRPRTTIYHSHLERRRIIEGTTDSADQLPP